MRTVVIIAASSLLGLAACGQPASAPAEPPAAPVATQPAVAQPAAATPADLEAACRDAVARLAGQTGDDVQFQKTGEDQASLSWRAPVDGGRMTMQCKTGDGRVELSANGRQMAMSLSAAPAPAAQQEAH